ncbi:universal stress protein [Nostocoides sp. F2B08]|uniref:universal stress protein n=1 Tax=Nostocoides sp. F2B08 TaxID=2653936 RepID=UPI0012639181|nr:universal stress protein [Tetrasphaera sp. F2B08]KAB7739553.1 universal stress protein [Tetrasphaera sp. F2B08]
MTILLGFSPHQDDTGALELACQLARSDRDSVHAVTVVPQAWPTAVAGDTDRDFRLWAQEEGEHSTAVARELLAEHADIPSRASWCSGRSVPQTLLDRAAELEASLIVVGSGVEGPHGRISLTSKTDRLLHSSDVPVAVAPRGYWVGPTGRIGRATLGFRGDDATWSLLDRAAGICSRVDASLRLVTFAVRSRPMRPTLVSGSEEMVHTQWVRQAAAEQAEALEHLRSLGFAEERVSSIVAVGASWGGAMDRLEWNRDDVLVVGSSSSSTLLSRVFLGSSAAKIVRNSPVPVIVVP